VVKKDGSFLFLDKHISEDDIDTCETQGKIDCECPLVRKLYVKILSEFNFYNFNNFNNCSSTSELLGF
jgi:hypothetical protein